MSAMIPIPARTPHSITKHLLKEAHELHAAPDDLEEWADVVMLAVALIQDGTPNAPRDLIGALRRKLEINRHRTWGEPDADGVVEHVAELLNESSNRNESTTARANGRRAVTEVEQ